MKKNTGEFLRHNFGAALAFLLPVLFFLSLAVLRYGIVHLGPDAELYLSVADNFLSTGHFIQTARDAEGFVVPFGLPLILTAFRALRMSVVTIVIFQHFMTGGSSLLLYLAEKNRLGHGGFASTVFCLVLFKTRVMPNNFFVECYYLFFLCLILWLLSCENMPLQKKLLWLNTAGFCAFVIRPVLIIVWVPIIAYTVICVIKKQFPLRRAMILKAVFALILGINVLVNYRETGHWVWMENYSGRDLYAANNPHTLAKYYWDDRERFVGEEYYAIVDNDNLDQTEKNDALNSAAKKWIAEEPLTFIKNTVIKFYIVFLRYWKYITLIALVGGIAAIWSGGPECRRRLCWELGINLAVAVASSCVTVMGRYTLPIWPLASLHMAVLFHALMKRLPEKYTAKPYQTNKDLK